MCGRCGIAVSSTSSTRRLISSHERYFAYCKRSKKWQWEQPGNEARLTQYSYYWLLCDVVKETSH